MPRLPSVETMMANDEASRALGIELIDQDEGRAVTRMTVRGDMVNGHAIAHGGLIFTLADTAFACACNSFGPVTVARARRGRAGGRGGAADQVRPVRSLRRDRAPRRRGDRGVSRPQSSARARLVSEPEGRRRGRPGHDLASVLAAAVELFNERGYDGTSMRDLAARLGIAKSAIYHHVAGKEELLSLALDRALDGLAAVTSRARALPAPAIERLEYLVRGSVEVLEAESSYVTLLLRVRGNSDVERAALDQRRAFDRFVAELVAEAVRDGDIRSDADATLTARLLFGLVNSIVEWYRPDRRAKTAPLADAVCALAFDGLRARRPRPVRQ
jgi:AcrR family transcriptional regulator